MLHLYCPACRLRFNAGRPLDAPGECPRCGAGVPGTRAIDANAWLASTVLAEMRRSRFTPLAGAPPADASGDTVSDRTQ
jgi:hypothetical protein